MKAQDISMLIGGMTLGFAIAGGIYLWNGRVGKTSGFTYDSYTKDRQPFQPKKADHDIYDDKTHFGEKI